MHFKFGMQIDIDKHWHIRDRLPQKGMCLGSSEFFNFCKVTDNILETV